MGSDKTTLLTTSNGFLFAKTLLISDFQFYFSVQSNHKIKPNGIDQTQPKITKILQEQHTKTYIVWNQFFYAFGNHPHHHCINIYPHLSTPRGSSNTIV